MKNAFIDGEKIYLREITINDLTDNYSGWFNDSEVCAYNEHHRFPRNEMQLRQYYESVIKSKNNLVLAIINKETDKHIGNVSLSNIDYVNSSAEFAIIIGNKEFWGKGVGYEATELIIEHGFKTLNLHRIFCGTSEDNMVMQKLADKLGFQSEGRFKEALYKDGKYRDFINYGLLNISKK